MRCNMAGKRKNPLDKRGAKSVTHANREKSFMSRLFRWAYERGMVKLNPCKGVKQFKEVARERYIAYTFYTSRAATGSAHP